jgi:Zn-dependent membrane protease YugP
MLFVIAGLLVLLLVAGLQLWVRYVLWRHSKNLDAMPGTGAELARHLVERFGLETVEVIEAPQGQNYYSPTQKKVALSPENYAGKSITAVAVAAHEVGHAIQFCRQEPVSRLRQKYMGLAAVIQKLGGYFLMSAPIVMVLFKVPALGGLIGLVAVGTMLISVLMYVAILPEEFDASFNKALPILREGYLPPEYMGAATSVLRACALTYVAGALLDVIRLWRWLRFIR